MTFNLPWVGEGASQEAYYSAAVQPVVERFLQIANADCGVLAYGATGSGKTYSTQARPLAPVSCDDASMWCALAVRASAAVLRALAPASAAGDGARSLPAGV